MMISPHIVTGATLGKFIENPVLLIILALASHFLLDMLPHYDIGTRYNYKKNISFDFWDWIFLIFDTFLGLAIVYLAFLKTSNTLILWGAFFAILPDIVDNIVRIRIIDGKLGFDSEKKIPIIENIHKFHKNIHFKLKAKHWYVGALVQLLILIGGYICLFVY